MAGSYPELFAAASAYSGVPFGCFAGASSWSTQCADGDLIQTAAQWVSPRIILYNFSLTRSIYIRGTKSGLLILATLVLAPE